MKDSGEIIALLLITFVLSFIIGATVGTKGAQKQVCEKICAKRHGNIELKASFENDDCQCFVVKKK